MSAATLHGGILSSPQRCSSAAASSLDARTLHTDSGPYDVSIIDSSDMSCGTLTNRSHVFDLFALQCRSRSKPY